MKNQFKRRVLKFLFFLFFINNLNAQIPESNFQIKFYLDKNKIAMESENGNNWNSLFVKSNSFDLNQNGMLNVEKDNEAYEKSNYIFSVNRKGKEITLVGKKGTKWEKLVFIIPTKGSFVVINENGIKS